MDDEDDNWSYSFPPSTENLTCINSNLEAILGHGNTDDINLVTMGFDDVDAAGQQLEEHELLHTMDPVDSGVSKTNHFLEIHGTLSALNIPPMRDVLSKHDSFGNQTNDLQDNLNSQQLLIDSVDMKQKKFQQSLVLQPAFTLKLSPADPHTTCEEANLIISKENKSNALASELAPLRSSSSSPGSKNEFKNSIKIWQQKKNEGTLLLINSDQGSGSEAVESTSPKIITYRKTTHERKASSRLNIADQDDKFDTRLYVKEKYNGTDYRYATIKRNVEFHQLFKSIDLTNRLLDDFACAISREILLQGRIYVTEHCLCFNSNLLGWVTSLVVPFSEITRIDKKSTAGLFPNGIIVETRTSKHTFASFLSRDATFDFMRAIWLGSTGKNISELNSRPVEAFTPDTSNSSETRISNYIMSIDEGDNIDVEWTGDHSEHYESEISDQNTEEMGSNFGDITGKTEKVGIIEKTRRVMRPDSAYKNNGPDTHAPTKISDHFEGADEEIEVLNELIEAPLGAVFEILFGLDNTAFHEKILKQQGATSISDYDKYELPLDGQSKLERSYTYQRPLGYSIGPKSTKCCVKEIIEYQDSNHSIVVLTVTDTPDVPSGGSFSVMTRFYLTWGNANSTNIKIAYHIKWTGRSWIKSMVEKLTQSAQASVSKTLIELLKKEAFEQTQVSGDPPMLIANETLNLVPEDLPQSQKEDPLLEEASKKRPFLNIQDYLVSVMAFLVILMLLYSFLIYTKIMTSVSDLKANLVEQQELLKKVLEHVNKKEYDS